MSESNGCGLEFPSLSLVREIGGLSCEMALEIEFPEFGRAIRITITAAKISMAEADAIHKWRCVNTEITR